MIIVQWVSATAPSLQSLAPAPSLPLPSPCSLTCPLLPPIVPQCFFPCPCFLLCIPLDNLVVVIIVFIPHPCVACGRNTVVAVLVSNLLNNWMLLSLWIFCRDSWWCLFSPACFGVLYSSCFVSCEIGNLCFELSTG